MAQQPIEWLKEQLQQLEHKIEEQEAKIDNAVETKKAEDVIKSYERRKDSLVNEKDKLHDRIQLASTAGEVLALAWQRLFDDLVVTCMCAVGSTVTSSFIFCFASLPLDFCSIRLSPCPQPVPANIRQPCSSQIVFLLSCTSFRQHSFRCGLIGFLCLVGCVFLSRVDGFILETGLSNARAIICWCNHNDSLVSA